MNVGWLWESRFELLIVSSGNEGGAVGSPEGLPRPAASPAVRRVPWTHEGLKQGSCFLVTGTGQGRCRGSWWLWSAGPGRELCGVPAGQGLS